MTIEITSNGPDWITIVYNEERKFQFEIIGENKNVRFKRADSVIKQDSGYRAGGNSERTFQYKMPHFEGPEEDIPIEVINTLKKEGYLKENYPN